MEFRKFITASGAHIIMDKSEFREITTISGAHIIMGKDEKSNDKLMEQLEGKRDTIIHTSSPGSPFCVITNSLSPSKYDLKTSGSVCVKYSQAWRDNKGDVMVNIFNGKNISKDKRMKPGTWKVKHAKKLRIKKEDVLNL